MNNIAEEKKSKHREGFNTTKEVTNLYKISHFTLRTWRRGWYTGSKGKSYFFKDKVYLEHIWCIKHRRYEYDPIKLAVWVHKLKEKKHRSAVAKGRMKKKKQYDKKD